MPTTVTMWDAVDVSSIPADSSPIGVYVDPPPYINTVAAVTSQFPKAKQVSITASGVAGARIGDRENGNMSPAQLAQWDSDEIAADRRPTNYCSIDNVQECVDAINAIKLPLSLIDWFPADWNGIPHLAVIPGLSIVGTQYANPTYTHADYDLSLVLATWLNPFQLPIGAIPMWGASDKNGNDRLYYGTPNGTEGEADLVQATFDPPAPVGNNKGWEHVNLTKVAGLPPVAV